MSKGLLLTYMDIFSYLYSGFSIEYYVDLYIIRHNVSYYCSLQTLLTCLRGVGHWPGVDHDPHPRPRPYHHPQKNCPVESQSHLRLVPFSPQDRLRASLLPVITCLECESVTTVDAEVSRIHVLIFI